MKAIRVGGEELIRFEEDGRVYVSGKLATDDVDAMELLRKRLDAPKKARVDELVRNHEVFIRERFASDLESMGLRVEVGLVELMQYSKEEGDSVTPPLIEAFAYVCVEKLMDAITVRLGKDFARAFARGVKTGVGS